MTVVM